MTRLERILPASRWLKTYERETMSADLLAAVIVTIMLIPQSLAYALLAGLPAHVGLYASIAPLIAYALFGSSSALAVGPVAVISLLTAASVGRIVPGGDPAAAMGAALVLAFLSGGMLVAMGVLRLGFLANLLSHPVISGFITASGILIATSQLKHILGVEANGHSLVELVRSLIEHIPEINTETLAVGAGATGFLFWVRKGLKPLLIGMGIPPRPADMLTKAGPVLAVIVTTAAAALWNLAGRGVAIVGEIPQGLPPVTLPGYDMDLWLALLPAAAIISLIGFVESVSVAQTLAAKRRERIDPDQELVGLGAANIAASMTGGYPVTGGFARSVVNFDAGAATPMAGVFTAFGIAVTALFLTPYFYFLPKATLAATIVVAVLSLVDLGALKRAYRYSKSDFAAMAATILVTLAVGVEAGVVTGVVLSVLLFLWATSRPHYAIVGQVPGTEHFRNVKRHQVVTSPHVLSIRVDESLYFANARYLEDRIYDHVAESPAITDIVLMCPAVNLIDGSALESLEAINERLQSAGVRFHLSEVKGPVMDRLKHTDFLQHLTGQVFLSQFDALCALDPDAAGCKGAKRLTPAVAE